MRTPSPKNTSPSDQNRATVAETFVDVSQTLPLILVIDDLFGRQVQGIPNRERANLCGMYSLRDMTGDEPYPAEEEVVDPLADAVFFRGQQPLCAKIGDTVENDLEATIAFVRKGWYGEANTGHTWSLVLLDLCFYTGTVTSASNDAFAGMPTGRPGDDNAKSYFGLTMLKKLREEFPELPVIILSSKQRDEVSREFTEAGALGFISRTDSSGRTLLKDYLWRHGLMPDPSGTILGTSLPLLLALRLARRAATGRRNVLIRGERGAGKDLLAHYINRYGTPEGEQRPCMVVDCGALPPTLWGSELFGHVKGSFTGADRERKGRIVQADGGDLFLDEIGSMPSDVQDGLLRVIDTREVIPLGANSGRTVDVRFIAATNVNIEQRADMETGFRSDLLDRLKLGGRIWLPPLRERREDIPLLAERFVREEEAACESAMTRQIDSGALQVLLEYDWPGNIRELRSVIHEAVTGNPDVEHLVAGHLQLESVAQAEGIKNSAEATETAKKDSPPKKITAAEKTTVAQPERPRISALEELIGSFDRLVLEFHEQVADIVEGCLAAYRDPLTGRINYTGAYRLAISSASQSSNPPSDAKRWFRMLFQGKNGLVPPLPADIVEQRPLLLEARQWACGSKL